MPQTFIGSVPRIDFTSLNFANMLLQEGQQPSYYYSNPQYSVLEAVAASTTERDILSMTPTYQNATWLLEFPGPALSCQNIEADSALYKNISDNILAAMVAPALAAKLSPIGEPCLRSFGYISWVPTVAVGSTVMNPLPFPNVGSFNDTTYEPPSETLGPLFDEVPTASANSTLSLYVAALPSMDIKPTTYICLYPNGTYDAEHALNQLANMTITQCTTYNATYIANFTYTDGAQSVNLTTQGSYDNYVTGVMSTSDVEDVAVQFVENLAYQTVVDAFGRIIVGTIMMNNPNDNAADLSTLTLGSQMSTTSLLNTIELNFLQTVVANPSNSLLSLEAYTGTAHSEEWNGFSVLQVANSTLPMASAIEEMFKNATMSLMSSPYLK